MDPGGQLIVLAEKLVHPLVDVRRRAVQSLDFKLRNDLVRPHDLLLDASILRHLLESLKHDNGEQTDAALLLLLQKVAANPQVGRQLVQLGAEVVLAGLKSSKPTALHPLVDSAHASVVAALSTAPATTGRQYSSASCSSSVTLSPGVVRERGVPPASSRRPVSSTRSSADSFVSFDHSRALSHHQTPAATPHLNATVPPAASAAHSGASVPSTSALTYGQTGWVQREPALRHARATSAAARLGPAAPPQSVGSYHSSTASSQANARGHPGSVHAQRQHGRQEVARGRRDHTSDAGGLQLSAADVCDWWLPRVNVGAADEQHLFELGCRLKGGGRDRRVVLPALREVTRALLDFPPEVLATQLDTLAAVMRLISAGDASVDLVNEASTVLLLLLGGLKRAIGVAADVGLSASCPGSATADWEAVQGTEQAPPSGAVAYVTVHGSGGTGKARAAAPGPQVVSHPQPLTSGSSSVSGGSGGAVGGGDHVGAGGAGDGVNVTQLAHAVAQEVFALLSNPDRHAMLLPLVHELLPLLLVGRQGAQIKATEQAHARWSSLLQLLSAALLNNIAIAAAESAATVAATYAVRTNGHHDACDDVSHLGVGGGSRAGDALLLNSAAASLLSLAARLVSALPPALWSTVPPALSQSLAAVARGELLGCLMPGLRHAVLPALAVLRPDAIDVLDAAGDGERALAAAEALMAQEPDFTRDGSAEAWLSLLASALPALDLTSGEPLLEAVVRGLAAMFAGSGEDADPGLVPTAELAFLQLLSHRLAHVRLAMHAMLSGMTADARGRPAQLLMRLVGSPAVLEQLVVRGLADGALRAQTSRLLQELLQRGDTGISAGLVHWSSWVQQYDDDPQVGSLAASVALTQRDALEALPHTHWQRLTPLLQELFSRSPEQRQAAARKLRDALYLGGLSVPRGEQHHADPLKACLDDGQRDDLAAFTSVMAVASSDSAVSAVAAGRRNAQGAAVAAAAAVASDAARGFGVADAENLLSIVLNEGLAATDLRRSAAEQLLALVAGGTPRLVAVAAAPGALAAVAACAQGISASVPVTSTLRSQSVEHLMASLDVALPVACVNLLYATAARSADARRRLADAADSLLVPLLPLVFHPLAAVRRAVARLFAAMAFATEADKSSDWRSHDRSTSDVSGSGTPQMSMMNAAVPEGQQQQQQAGETSAPGSLLALPAVLARRHVFPCRVAFAQPTTRPGHDAALHSLTAGHPKLRALVLEQRLLVQVLVAERRLLRQAGGDLTAVLHLLDDAPDQAQLPPAVLHTCAANLRALLPGPAVQTYLRQVAGAQTHAECLAALRRLRGVAATSGGAQALTFGACHEAWGRFLSVCPATDDDRDVWLELLPLVQRCLQAGGTAQDSMGLARSLSNSIPAALSAPDAACEEAALPVALANSDAADEAMRYAGGTEGRGGPPRPGGGAPTWRSAAMTHAALTTLAQLFRRSRESCTLEQYVAVINAVGRPGPLLLLLCSCFVSQPEASYACRVAAVELMSEVLEALRSAKLAPQLAEPDEGVHDTLLLVIGALLKHILVASGGRQQAAGFRGKALLKQAMRALGHLMQLAPAGQWAHVWQQAGGIFMLTRLLRDREAVVRSAAAGLLAQLMAPGALAAHRMVLQDWRDGSQRMMAVALDDGECWAVRHAALRFLTCALAQIGLDGDDVDGDTDDHGVAAVGTPAAAVRLVEEVGGVDPHAAKGGDLEGVAQRSDEEPEWQALHNDVRRQLFYHPSAPLNRHAQAAQTPPLAAAVTRLLAAQHFWERLPQLLYAADAPPQLVAAAVSLLLQGLLVDSEAFLVVLSQPGLLSRLVHLMGEASWSLDSRITHPLAAGHSRELLQQQQQQRDAERDGRDTADSSSHSRAESSLTLAVAQLCGRHAGAPPGSLLPLASCPLETDLRRTADGVPGATTHSVTHHHAGQRERQPLLASLSAIAHILEIVNRSLGTVQLANLGQPPPKLAVALLTAFACTRGQAAGGTFAAAGGTLDAAGGTAAGESAAQASQRSEASAGGVAESLGRHAAALRLAAASNSVLLSLDEDAMLEVVQQALTTSSSYSGPHPTLLAAACAALLTEPHGAANPSPATAAVSCLLATLLSTQQLASSVLQEDRQQLLGGPGSDASHPDALGGLLFTLLLAQLPHSTFSPGGSAAAQQWLSGHELAPVVALRNLLAYSAHAKAAAVRQGWHVTLMQCCGYVAGAPGSEGGRGSAAESVSGSATAPTTRTANRKTGASVSTTFATKTSSSAAANARIRPAPYPHTTSSDRLPPNRTTATVVTAAAAGFNTSPARASSSQLVKVHPLSQRGSPSAVAFNRTGAPASPSHAAAVRKGVQRGAQTERLSTCVTLLSHLTYHGGEALGQALVQAGMIDFAHQVWATAALPAAGGTVLQPLLALVTNLVCCCTEARAQLTTVAGGPAASLAMSVMQLMFQPSLNVTTFRLAAACLGHLAATADGATHMMRTLSHDLLEGAARLMAAHAPPSASAAGGTAAAAPAESKQQRAAAALAAVRQSAVLQVLANLAAHADAQRGLLRGKATAGLLEHVIACLEVPHQQPAGKASALRERSADDVQRELQLAAMQLVRNLALCPDAKTHLLSHPALLPRLLDLMESAPTSAPRMAALAASTLQALIYHCEKVKSLLKALPGSVPRLLLSHAAMAYHLSHLTNVEHDDSSKHSSFGRSGRDAAPSLPTPQLHTQADTLTLARLQGHKGAPGFAAGEALGAVRDFDRQALQIACDCTQLVLDSMQPTKSDG